MGLFDSHVHLDDDAFDPDRDVVLARAREAGVDRMVTVGTDLASSRAAVGLAERHAGVYAAVAIHPHAAAAATEGAFSELRALAMHPKVVAIGETGLDFGGRSAPVEAQRDAFRAHLILAWERRLPVIVHCRGAHRDVLEMLADVGTAVVMHAFSGSVETVRECAACGYFISLAGPITFRNADLPVKVAREVPAALLLVETDAPVLAPHPCRGKRNEPAYLRYIVDRLAEIRAVPVEDLIEMSAANAARVFGV
ncbi:MAG TPA: TatD family hydrolase [bacterium]|nr:TatD family hydrolase [bacterium]